MLPERSHGCQGRFSVFWTVRGGVLAVRRWPFRHRGSSDRGNEFRQWCQGLGIKGVSLHGYRNSWAKRARKTGYSQRYAQEALGHNSKAVHQAYAKRAEVDGSCV
jgi:integrase